MEHGVKEKISVHLSDLDVKSSKVSFSSAHTDVILACFEKSGAEFKFMDSENCLQLDFFVSPKIKRGQVNNFSLVHQWLI
jgi:hypothetical protein